MEYASLALANHRRVVVLEKPFYDRPCAAKGLTSYRCRGRYGWVMIGAKNDADAYKEALRSTDKINDMQVWDGKAYRSLTIGESS